MEVRELADSVLYRLERLEASAARWGSARETAEAGARARREQYDRDAFHGAIAMMADQQREIFDDLELLLSTWARLSLLLSPTDGKSEASVFARDRGTLLRELLQIDSDSPLLGRDLRNSWMHFDERLDAIIRRTGTWGNRHQFIHSSERIPDRNNGLRIVEVDTLVITFPDHKGVYKSTSLRELRPLLESMPEQIRKANEEFARRFPRDSV